MANITLDKVVQVEPISMQVLLAGDSIQSPEIDVSQTRLGRIFFDLACIGNGTACPAKVEVQVSQKATGSDTWTVCLQRMSMQLQGGTTTVGVNVFANDTFFNVTDVWATAGYLPQRWIFFNDANIFVNSEWANVVSFVTPLTTVRDPIQFNHVSTDGLHRAARYSYEVDFSSVKRARIIVYNNSSRGTTGPLDHVVRVGLILTGAVNG
jgi:hypothetical protein